MQASIHSSYHAENIGLVCQGAEAMEGTASSWEALCQVGLGNCFQTGRVIVDFLTAGQGRV